MKIKAEKEFDAVNFMREQRNSLSEKLMRMSKEEIKDYFNQKRLGSGVKPSA